MRLSERNLSVSPSLSVTPAFSRCLDRPATYLPGEGRGPMAMSCVGERRTPLPSPCNWAPGNWAPASAGEGYAGRSTGDDIRPDGAKSSRHPSHPPPFTPRPTPAISTQRRLPATGRRKWMRAWVLGLALASVGASIGTAAMAEGQVPPAAPVQPAATPVADAQPGVLTLSRVFGSPELSGSQPRALRLSPDGTLLTSLRPRADEKERLDLWARDTRTGVERMLVDSKKVGSGAELSEAEKDAARTRADRRIEGNRRVRLRARRQIDPRPVGRRPLSRDAGWAGTASDRYAGWAS